ncbi:hypothetical protein EOD39_10602 [Acipenser ruthenus]|uniref:Uncharacterized protein n=1 Tax=Acipenser ruthenus TaxID=7906 RepID=A0A444TXH6_ACIRT|nr:hypothetical protein EOD39_10602 [Acipenser ruthenus]
MQTAESLIRVFQKFDCISYLLYGSWYMERIKKLEVDNPILIHGHFVVREKEGKFISVAPDMKLEQTIQRSQKSSKGIVGQTRRSDYVAECQLVYHEVLAISNVFCELTNAKKANAKVHEGVCQRCKDVLEWKIKFNKYKALDQSKKCVKCLQKTVRDAYYIMCKPCALKLDLCAKCGKKEEIVIP